MQTSKNSTMLASCSGSGIDSSRGGFKHKWHSFLSEYQPGPKTYCSTLTTCSAHTLLSGLSSAKILFCYSKKNYNCFFNSLLRSTAAVVTFNRVPLFHKWDDIVLHYRRADLKYSFRQKVTTPS